MKNRRDFIKYLSAVALASSIYLMVDTKKVEASSIPIVQTNEIPPLPWPYVELDVEEVRKLGHLGYYAFACSGGAFWAIIISLRDKVGYPYTLLPLPSIDEVKQAVKEKVHINVPLIHGEGGAFGWGSLCGALNGAGAAISMVSENWKEIGKILFRWYETFPFPSDASNEYAVNHQFLVEKYKSDKPLPRSVSNSVSCHVSVSRWCVKSGYASGSKERSERCGRLTGDVAAMAVELLNADLRGELDTVAKLTFTPETLECRICHYKGKDYEMGQFTRGFLQCESCHTDMRPHISSNTLNTAFDVPIGTWSLLAAGLAIVGTGIHLGRKILNSRKGGKGGES